MRVQSRTSRMYRLDDIRQLVRFDRLISGALGVFEGHDVICTGQRSKWRKIDDAHSQQIVSYLGGRLPE
jgi:hypothetical protein